MTPVLILKAIGANLISSPLAGEISHLFDVIHIIDKYHRRNAMSKSGSVTNICVDFVYDDVSECDSRMSKLNEINLNNV